MPPKPKRKRFKNDDDDDDYEYLDDKDDYFDFTHDTNEDDEFLINPAKSKSKQKKKIEKRNKGGSKFVTIGTSTLDESGPQYLDLSQTLTLKLDHEKRPIWITSNSIIILEAFSPYYHQAYDFLIDIAEPISRPTYFQTYQLTEDSLYSAVAVSRNTDSIIKVLNVLCEYILTVDSHSFPELSPMIVYLYDYCKTSRCRQNKCTSRSGKVYSRLYVHLW
jgi:hypothetical protein